jgi:hypothetical protein
MDDKIIKSKNSQITILVIIALIIIVSIVLAVTLVKKPNTQIGAFENPSAYIENCIKQSLEKNTESLVSNNGYKNITDNYLVYLGQKVPFMCKADRFYYPCVNQEPLFIEKIRKQLEEDTKKNVENCFGNLTKSFEKKGYDVVLSGNSSYSLKFRGDALYIEITKKITLKKGDESKIYDKFYGSIISPLYRLVNTERHIVNFESSVCNFDYITWEKYYRDILITKFVTGDNNKVYTLKDVKSGKTMSFAVRSCALPAGL